MSDVFISYSRHDLDRARALARGLEAHQLSVWWDRAIPPGKTFDEVIEEALDAAGCVVVLWSESSVKSSWVKTEAAEAARRGVLIPILIDPVKIPLEFRRLQTADLTDWNGEANHAELDKALAAIRDLVEPSSDSTRATARSTEKAGDGAAASAAVGDVPSSVRSGALPGLADAEPERRSLLLTIRQDGGGYTHKQLAVGYLITVVLLISLGKLLPPETLNGPLSATLLFLAIPVYAMIRLHAVPFRVARVFALAVLLGALIAAPYKEGEDPVGFVLAVWLFYLVVAGALWALPRLRGKLRSNREGG